MKVKLRQIIAILALFLAIVMIITGGLGYLLISNEPQKDHLISENRKEILENVNRRQEIIDNAEYGDEVTHAEGSAIAEARENYSSSIQKYGIGTVYIPASNISIPLLAGTDEWNLLNGVATGKVDQELGEGLFVGMSHNLVNQRLLQNIDQAQKNDLVYLTDFEDVYTYKISKQKVVHETDSSYFEEPTNEDAKLLLYRCEGEYNTDYRRIIYGDYLEKQKINEVNEEILIGLMIDLDEIETKKDTKTNSSKADNFQSQSKINNETKHIFQRVETKIIDSISQKDILFSLCLRIYRLADSYTVAFFIFILFLFVIYYIA